MRDDRGQALSATLLRRQIAAMPCGLYEVRLIHSGSRKPYPGVRRWTASRMLDPATVRFLRIRNREDYDVYFRPYADGANAGYILLDLDQPGPDGAPGFIARLRAQGHEPGVVVETSPGRLQAWIRVSREPLIPALATAIARQLARTYAADRASADWRHVGRLAGFANRKPARRQSDGLAPWVKLIYAGACMASQHAALIELAAAKLPVPAPARNQSLQRHVSPVSLDPTPPGTLYQICLQRLRILDRYPRPDWSIADKWVASELLQTGATPATVAAALRHGSPGFPRKHGDAEDYLRRTLSYAARQINPSAFPMHPSSHPRNV